MGTVCFFYHCILLIFVLVSDLYEEIWIGVWIYDWSLDPVRDRRFVIICCLAKEFWNPGLGRHAQY